MFLPECSNHSKYFCRTPSSNISIDFLDVSESIIYALQQYLNKDLAWASVHRIAHAQLITIAGMFHSEIQQRETHFELSMANGIEVSEN